MGGFQVVNRAGARVSLALVFALGSLLVVGLAPVSAAQDFGCTGNCGYYEVQDDMANPGARCTYGTSYPYKLKEISIRPPLMHGDHPNKTPVAWAFRITRMPVGGGKWKNIFESGYQSSTASETVPAYGGHGFSRRTWSAPSHPAGYFYRVALLLRWKYNGSVEGTARVRYETYKRVSGMNYDIQPNYCLASF